MIKYSIFIQGGESMKKVISILLLTFMCAMVFVGCGSGENKTTSSISISESDTISKYLPHSKKVTWDSNVYDVMNNDDVKMDNDYVRAITTYSPAIESITFESAMYTFENSKIKQLSYHKKDDGDYQIISYAMSKLYGESYLDMDDVAAWHITYPNGEKGDISLVKNASTGNLVLMYLKSGDVSTSEGTSTNTSSKTVEPKIETPVVTTSQKNALKRAKQYLKTMPFSYTGLVEQLEFEQYSHDDAVYAADNCGADWNEQAAKKAQDYLDIMAFSRQGLIDQLQFEGYTYEQAVYGVNQVGL